MKRELYVTLSVVVLLLMGCGDKKTGGAEEFPEISVAYPLQEEIVLTKEYPGYLTTEKTVDLVARVNGTIQQISYLPGRRVKKGQVLFLIEPTVYQDNVLQAEAALNTARANLEYARNNYERMTEAVKSDAVSQIQVAQAASNVATAKAAVSNAEAALNTARTNLGYCTVRAPYDGTMSRSTVDVGSFVAGSGQPVTLATIYKDDRLYAYFNVSDNQWLSMEMQRRNSAALPDSVSINLGEGLPMDYPATMDYMSPNVDMQTGTLSIRASLDNPKGFLKSGMYVSITLPYLRRPDALLVPDASIGTDQLGKFLYVVNDSNTVRYRHIEVGQLVNDSLRYVTSGLSPRERYVTKALMKVRDGMTVRPVEQ
ncbi:MAG: efflux RND transporter periplasmic adaptor subunit [Bacteroides sp.]|nr:efflux RND transporter periplasmic adaptor subunit [Bacteroides sp.]